MSKRKDGSKIVDIPQPEWPELAYFDGDKMHRIVPVVARDGSATYDCSKLGATAEALVDQAVAQKVRDNPKKVIRVVKATDVPVDAKEKLPRRFNP